MEATCSRQPQTAQQTPARGQWHTQCDFILSCIGNTVGLLNIWRFPYMSLRYGGVTFLLPYLTMLVVMGVPLYVMELALGQYTGAGPRQVFRKIAPLFSGVGTAMLVMLAFYVFTYNLAVAWSVFFAAASFSRELAWGRCGHEFNTADCFTVADDRRCLNESNGKDIFWNNTCFSREKFLEEHNVSSARDRNPSIYSRELVNDLQDRRVSSSEEYFFNYVLGLCNSLKGHRIIRWDISLCMLLAWLLVAACISRGITSIGRILHFTVIFPYFALLLLLLPAATFDGALEGIQFYGSVNASLLWSPALWSDAASQIFFSLSVGHGDLMMLASFSRLRNNCMRDAILVSVINTLTSVLSVLVVFAMLGVTAKQLGRDVDDVFAPGLGLSFVAYPAALVHMPVPPVFSVIFFVMLITLGLDSQFIMVAALVLAVVDEWPVLRPRRRWISAGVCALFFAANLCMCWDGGVLVFALVDHYAYSFSQFAVALLEVVAVAWVFGAERLVDLMRKDMEIPMSAAVRLYWIMAWRYAVPVVLLSVLGVTVVFHVPASFTAGRRVWTFPGWADGIGLVLMFAPAVLVLLVAVIVVVKQRQSGGPLKEVLNPTADWGPARREEWDSSRSSESSRG